jgi:hypothetical protein
MAVSNRSEIIESSEIKIISLASVARLLLWERGKGVDSASQHRHRAGRAEQSKLRIDFVRKRKKQQTRKKKKRNNHGALAARNFINTVMSKWR